MKAEYADSMVAKYKAKPILDRAVLDDMEVDRSWKATGPGSIAYTSENAKTGKRALRLTTPIRSEKWIAEHRRPDGAFDGIYGNGWTYAALNFDSPQDWTAYNRISVWLYVHPAPIPNHVVAIRFHDADAPRGNTGDLESFSYYQNLVEGEWNELIWEFPEYPRTRVPALELMVQLRGNGPPATQLVYDIDRIELQRVDAEPYRGWSIREGVIAFNHVGYNLGDDKFALAGPTTAKTFQVLNAAGPVATLPIKQIRTLKGDFNVLDFSEIEKAGKYRIAVEGKPTRPFAISEAPWTETALKVLNFFYTLRCGFEVHGYHPDCHQDITAEHNGVTKTINGGWHDAGDLFQMAGRTHNILRGILELHDQAAAFRIDPGLQSKALEEAQWGLEWALKIRFGAGFRAGGFQTRFFSDNVIGTPDDTPGRVTFNAADTMSFCAAAGHAAWSIKAWDRDLALRCLSAAVEDYDAAIDKLAGPNGTIPHEVAANAVLASLDLFKATGEQRYKANAIKLGAVLLSCQEIRFVDGVPITGYFYTDTGRTQIVRDVHTSGWHLTTMATWRLCDAFPDHADWMSWYASNLIVSEYFLARGATVAAPYDYLPNAIWNEADIEAISVGNPTRTSAGLSSSPERNAAQQKEMARAGVPIAPKTVLKTFPVWRQDNAYLDQFIPFHGGAVIQISGAGCALGAAQLRRSRSSEQLAKKQVQWLQGGNPFGQSMIYGLGYDYQSLWAGLVADSVGGVPVGTDTFKTTEEPYWPGANIITSKEQFGEPAGKLLWVLAYAAMPAQVSGRASVGATLTSKSGRVHRVRPGAFSLRLAPGEYAVEAGAAKRKVTLVSGERRSLNLAPDWVQIDLTSSTNANGQITLTAAMTGSGRHALEVRLFNSSSSASTQSVDLSTTGKGAATWTFSLQDQNKPWVAVVVPDGRYDERVEAFGASSSAPRMPTA